MTMKEFAELDEKKRGEALALLGLFFSAPEEKPKEDKPEQSKAPMRTIPQAIAELKAEDPGTALTETALKRLVLTGRIPHITAGRKRLVNMDILRRYLNGTYTAQRGAGQNFER